MKISRKLLFLILLTLWSVPVFGQAGRIESIQGREVVGGEIIVRFRPTATGALSTIRQDPDTVSLDPVGRNGDVIIRSRQHTASELLQEYSGRTDVEFAEPNRVWHKTDIPNDPVFSQQWYLQNTGQQILATVGVAGADIRAVAAWNTTIGSRNIVVGVIDSGINYNHADLSDNMWSSPVAFDVTIGGQLIHCDAGTHGFNAITRTCDPMDDEGHGTAIAGVIGATGMNGFASTGINRISSLMALKFLNSSGAGSTTDAIAAIEFAIQVQTLVGVNVRILNASWGDGGFSQALMDEISSANTHNMLFVTSAGNNAANNDSTPIYPANFNLPNIISVAATDNRDSLAAFSNFGSSTVHLGAPGVNIVSTEFHNIVIYLSGTSMASPMVAGAAALLLAACPQNNSGLKATLLNNVDLTPALSGRTISGGRLNVAKAMNGCPGGVATFNLSASRASFVAVRTLSAVITANGTAGYSGNVQFSAVNLPSGVTAVFNPPSIVGSGSTVMTVNIPAGLTPNTYPFVVLANDGFISKTFGSSFFVPPQLPIGQTLNGSLSSPDLRSAIRVGAFADYFQFTLTSSSSITLDMRSTALNPFLDLQSEAGTLLQSDDNGGGGTSARIGPIVLAPGTYMIEATSASGESGQYLVGANIATLDSITPNSVLAGSTVLLTFKGNGFLPTAKAKGFVGGDISLNVVDSQTLTASVVISPATFPGVYDIWVMTTSPEFSQPTNSVPITVTAPPPTITSLSPGAIAPGTTVNFQLNGFGFAHSMTVNAGSGITTTLPSIPGANSATFQFIAAAGATPGVRNVTVSTTAGTSAAFPLTVTSEKPALTGITPSTFNAGTMTSITIAGSNFISGLQLQSDTGIGFSALTVLNGNTVLTTITVDSATSFGSHNIVAVTSKGTSNPITITVTPSPPTLTSMTPTFAGQGATPIIALTGSNYRTPLTLNVGASGDITVSNIVIADTSHLTATLNIAGTAALGNRDITVTTPGGTTAAQTFNIVAPFVDLAVTDITATPFYSGYPQTYSATVRNLGSLPTTGTTTLTHNMGSSFTISAASGPGWSCSILNGAATCLFLDPILPGGASTLTFTTTSAPGITGGVGVLFSVSTSGDLSTGNNSASLSTSLNPFPSLTIPPLSITKSGTQSEITLTRTSLFPYDLTGKLFLSFTPNPAVGIDDPFVQFSTGGKVVSFSIAANATNATFSNGSKLFLQSGSLAGTIVLSGLIDIPAPGTAKTINSQNFTIPFAIPGLISASIDATSGTAFVLNFLSNARNLSSVTFTFNTFPVVQVSCGTATGCSASKSNSVTFNTQDLFIDWFTANPGYGGASTLRVPFSLDRSITGGGVTVTITNSVGASAQSTIPLSAP